jgi:Tol biopolymer transport system component/DNA-binding winged helix-turn-helix (wHTH) protein
MTAVGNSDEKQLKTAAGRSARIGEPQKMLVEKAANAVRFGEFTLDLRSGELSRGDHRVILPDQPFRLLVTLITERGNLVTRETLQQQLWTNDTFVDFEAGLNAAVKRVREALGDSAASPVFIETLPRRGYRFIAPVDFIRGGDDPRDEHTLPAAAITEPPPPAGAVHGAEQTRFPRRWLTLGFAAASIVTAIVAFPSLQPHRPGTGIGLDAMVRLTNLGTVMRASLSADGRDLAYVTREGIQESLWIRRVNDANPTRLTGPLDGAFDSVTLAPQRFVYYTFFSPDKTNVALYRVPVDGGAPEVVVEASGWVAFSPDGSQYASIRNVSQMLRESRVLIVDTVSGSTRVLTTRRAPESFVMLKPAWSPDGQHLALVGASDRTPGKHEIVSVDVRDGSTRRIADVPLSLVLGAAWLPSGLELVIAGKERRAAPQRLWIVSASTGAMRALSSDVSDYELAGIPPDGANVFAVRLESRRSLWTAEASAPDRPTRIAEDAGSRHGYDEFGWSPDGQLLYTVVESGNADIWSLDPITRQRRRLTTDPADDFQPTVSPDGRTVVFSSNRAGATGLWSMSRDGTGLSRLTSGGDTRPSFSPDGKWVAFQRSGGEATPWGLYRLSLETSAVQPLTVPSTMRPDVSPDGRFVAHYWMTPERWVMAVTPVEGGVPTAILPVGPTHPERVVHWTTDGRGLTFIDNASGAANIWLQPLDRGPRRQVTHLASGTMATFDWSNDGSKLAWMEVQEVRDIVAVALPSRER